MLPVLLAEFVSSSKRRTISEIMMGQRKVIYPDVEDVKKKIRGIRDYSIGHMDQLIDEVTANLRANPGVDAVFANDVGQAVEVIKKISGGTKVAINKSAVVTKELAPMLASSGIDIIETYYNEYELSEKRFSEGWQLPEAPFGPLFESSVTAVDLTARRLSSIEKNGAKNFTGLLGVNAISADQGAVLLLQHTHNISKIFEQAKDIILVASLDKIVKSLDDAVFQTKCMAGFGVEALLLALGTRGTVSHQAGIDNLPFEIPVEQTAGKIHIVILDNDRSQILRSRYWDLLACIGCRACTKDCPAFPFLDEYTQWSPREYVFYFMLGKNPSLDLCLQCKSCQVNCPLDIDLPGLMLDAKTEFMSKKGLSLADRLLSNGEMLDKWGSSIPTLANAVLSNRQLRWFGEKMVGISRERQLPKMQRKAFAKWFRSGVTRN